ncbi:hypothetical protein ACHAWU_001688 [Discostella pseudostelligera]|uniref:Uncharacterized protein n=1 Tax=Discostella pseudostelligera TaxID=259834 RepID=A0ABD3MB88_9STRA
MDHSQSSSSPLSMAQNEATRDGSSLPSLSPPLPRMRRGCRRHNIRTNAKLVTTTAATLAVIISWFGSGNSAVANAQQKLQLQLQHQHLQQQIASTSSTNLRGLLPEWIEGGDEEDDSDSENIQANRELGTSANKKKKKDNQDADDNIIAKKEKIEIENELRKEVNQMLRNKKEKQKDKQQEKDKKQNGEEEEEEEEEEQQKDKKNKKNKKEQTQQQSSQHTQDKKKDKKEQIQMQSSQQTHDKKKDKKDKENNKEKEQQKPKKETKEEIKKKKEKQKNKQDGDDNDKPKKPNQQTATLPTESKNQNDGKKDDDKKPSKKDESKNDDDNNNKPSKKDEPDNKPSKKDDVTSSGTSVTTTTTSTGAAIAGSAGQLGTTTTTTTTTSTTAVGAGSAGQPGTTTTTTSTGAAIAGSAGQLGTTITTSTIAVGAGSAGQPGTTTTSTGAAVVVSSAGPWKFVNALSDPSIPLDSFEASTSGKLQWTSSSSNPWTSSQVASDGTSSMASGITSAISGSLQPVYSNLTLATDSNFEGGVLTFRLLAKSLVFPRESFFVMVDETVELLPEDVVTTNGNWMEYSVPVGKGAHKVTWVHVYNLFGLKVLPSVEGGGEVGLWMDDLRLAPFASLKYVDQLTLEMINGGGSASWEATGNSIVASSSNIQGSEGSANIQFALYSSKGAKLTYRIQTSTSGPHDDFTILFNNNTAIASTMFGDMIGYESRSLTIPKGKVVVTLSHRKNPGQLDSTVLQSLGAVGTEGKTWLEGLSLNLIA